MNFRMNYLVHSFFIKVNRAGSGAILGDRIDWNQYNLIQSQLYVQSLRIKSVLNKSSQINETI